MALNQTQIDLINDWQKNAATLLGHAMRFRNKANEAHAMIQADHSMNDPANLTFAGMKARFGPDYTELVDALNATMALFPVLP